jgi:hypothetical protein
MKNVNRGLALHFLVAVLLVACPKLQGQSVLETEAERFTEQSHPKGWWPTNGSAPRTAYTGPQACAPCHPSETASWEKSQMAHALRPAAESEFLRAHPHLSYHRVPYTYRIDLEGNEALYSVTDGHQRLSLPLLWAYGVGVVGQAFVFSDNETYYEAEVAYYPSLGTLDVVAGLPPTAPPTLQEAAGLPLLPSSAQQCISCHTTAAVTNDRLQVQSAILGVSCEACHGPGARHIAAMKTASQPGKRRETFILNPASLNPAETEDFCGACHRTSLRVQMKGLHGLETIHYQPYRLELSSCWIMTQQITCLTCHNPHEPLERTSSAYDSACLACHSHPKGGGAAVYSSKLCPVAKEACTNCHMPNCRLPLAPFSMSDHFIRVVRLDDPCNQTRQ